MAPFMQMKLNMSVSIIVKTEPSWTGVCVEKRFQLKVGLLMFSSPLFDLCFLMGRQIKLESVAESG